MEEGEAGGSPWVKRFLVWLKNRNSPQETADLEKEIQELEEKGVLSQQDGEMIESLLDFGEILAREVMVPRTEVKAFPIDATTQTIVDLVKECGHSRFPIYSSDIDHILGILHVKDLLAFWGGDEVKLKDLLRPVMFVPETKKITDLLAEMRHQRGHMAVVIDEYGGTSGILTIEDIIEEIVGEIQDEHDSETPKLETVNEDEVLVDARLDVDEVEEFFQIEIPKNGFDTIGGLISSLTGQVPPAGDSVQFGNLNLTIEEADERRIKKVRISRAPSS